MGAIFGKNDYPIVLIHGFLGWGPDEMGGYKYWGGKDDIADLLRQEGHTVFEVSVGPVSSNWDRAVEVYAQLKGGQVDYGKAHSEKFGLIQNRKGKPLSDYILNGMRTIQFILLVTVWAGRQPECSSTFWPARFTKIRSRQYSKSHLFLDR